MRPLFEDGVATFQARCKELLDLFEIRGRIAGSACDEPAAQVVPAPRRLYGRGPVHARQAGAQDVPLRPTQMRRIVHAIAFGRDPSRQRAHAEAAALHASHASWWNQRNVAGLCSRPK